MSRVYPAVWDPAAAADVSYADPATGEINRAAHRGWIAHHSHNGCDTLLISCRLHGRLHPALDLNLHRYTNYAVTMQEFASVLYAASSPTCHVWYRHTDAAFERWQFSWGRPVQHFLFMAKAMGGPAAFRRRLAAAADFALPPSRGVSTYDCFVRCRSHRRLESVCMLYPATADDLATVIACLGVVLTAPSYTTCEQAATAYQLLFDDLADVPRHVDADGADGHLWPMQAYLYTARTLHRFVSAPIAYAMTRSLEALPA